MAELRDPATSGRATSVDWLWLPLSTGNHVSVTPAGTPVQDCLISCVLLLSVYTAYEAASTISSHLAYGTMIYLRRMVAVLLDVACSCVIVFLLWRGSGGPKCRKGQGRVKDEVSAQNRGTAEMFKRVIKEKMALIGVTCFYIPCVALFMIALVSQGECAHYLMRCSSEMFVFVFSCDFTKKITQFVLVTLLVVFAFKFHDKEFTTNILGIRYSLVFILGNLMSALGRLIYLEQNIDDAHPVIEDEIYNKSLANCFPVTSNSTWGNYNKTTACLQQQLIPGGHYRAIIQYSFPFRIELLLLACEVVGHLFLTAQTSSHPTRRGAMILSEDDPEAEEEDETSNLVAHSNRILGPYGSVRLRREESSAGGRSVWVWVGSLAGFLVGAFFFAVSLIATRRQSFTLMIISKSCLSLDLIVTSLVVLSAFRDTRIFRSHFVPYTHLELLVVLSAFGIFFQCFYVMLIFLDLLSGADIQGELNNDTPASVALLSLTIVVDLVIIMLVYLQTCFMLHISRVKPPPGPSPQRHRLKASCAYLAVSNLCLWAQQSFVIFSQGEGGHYSTFFHCERGYMCAGLLKPIAVFYTFYSCLILFAASLDL